jgi:acetylornithine deacetylase/succinyl-diaminopimelate desuccinylase-like protein
MVYGHYDVQPADPESKWTTPPFEPEVRQERLYARGASDDKGNMLAPILAAEALLRSTGLPLNVKFFFEGEEEIGSPNLAPVFEAQAGRFACDVVYSADGFQWGQDQPSLTTALRGICAIRIDVYVRSRTRPPLRVVRRHGAQPRRGTVPYHRVHGGRRGPGPGGRLLRRRL